jgi:hypothetical protein
LAIALVLIAVFGMLVMLLWNWLLPAITFLQAMGLLALSRILFGGLGGMERIAAGGRRRDVGDHVNPFREKWGKMSDEERREFLHRQHFFHHEDPPSDPNNGKE